MLKAVIFDMDGVIADTEPGYKITTTEFLSEQGIEIEPDYLLRFTGVTNEFMWNCIFKETGLSGFTVDACVDIINKKRDALMAREGLNPLPGVIDFIHRLSDAGIQLAIASSSSPEEINRVMDTFHIRSMIRAYASGEECEHGKPEPDVFLKAADLLGMDPANCLVIEDSRNGLLAAKRAGMRSIGFDNPDFHQDGLHEYADLITDAFHKISVQMCQELF